MKHGKQNGTISFAMAGMIATGVVIALLAAAVWAQQLRVEAASSAKKVAEEQLAVANTRIDDVAKINQRLDETLILFKSFTEVNKAQAIVYAEDNKKLLESVAKVSKTLPPVKAKATEPVQPKAQVDTSYKRAVAMQEAFCLVEPSNAMCFQLKPATTLSQPS